MSFESKKLSIVRIYEVLKKHSDEKHPLKYADIQEFLFNDFGIDLERKAIARNINMLIEADYDIKKDGNGVYLLNNFDESELMMLVDCVFCCRHIPDNYTRDLIEKLLNLGSEHFRKNVKIGNIRLIKEWDNTNNKDLFDNIEKADRAIVEKKVINFKYNKFGTDGNLKQANYHYLSPYVVVLHNQRYYIMGYESYKEQITFFRLDRITDMVVKEPGTTHKIYKEIFDIPGYERGINFKELSTGRPYFYNDKLENIVFKLKNSENAIDQVVDWFGTGARFSNTNDDWLTVTIKASPKAMKYWALQYVDIVKIVEPTTLKEDIEKSLKNGLDNYTNKIDKEHTLNNKSQSDLSQSDLSLNDFTLDDL